MVLSLRQFLQVAEKDDLALTPQNRSLINGQAFNFALIPYLSLKVYLFQKDRLIIGPVSQSDP